MLHNEGRTAALIYYLYVIDVEGVLIGIVSLRDLITANPDW